MTQIQTPVFPAIATGPRGIGARSVGGAYSQDAQQDIIDCDPTQGTPILLSGTTDILNPIQGGNYIITNASAADICTLAAPRVGLDDGVQILFHSNTAFAHSITCPSAIILNGAASAKTTAALAAFAGAMITLRAYQGKWLVFASVGTVSYS